VKNSFNDPFFTDPDYMEKEEKKFNSLFKKVLIFKIIFSVFLIIVIVHSLNTAGKMLQEKGGLGNIIGNFLEDVKNPKQTLTK